MFATYKHSPNEPATSAVAITPADSDLAAPVRGLYVGVAGDLVVRLADDSANVTIKNAAAGYHPLCVKRVAAATTATNIVGLR